ncbi:hypothetical protein Tco_0518259 [Tanacetum coccineum]
MTGFIGQPSMSSSIEKQKDNTKALLVKLLERLGLENSTGSHSNPKPSVNPIVYYTSANTSPTGYPYFQAQPIPQPTTTPGLVQFVPHAQSVVNCRFVMPAQHATPAQQVNSTQQVTSGEKAIKLAQHFTHGGHFIDPDACLTIPVTNTGHSILPTPTKSLHLNNVLITPHIVKNLIFVRDNNCTIEFDAFGFSVKNFLTRRVLLRCDSTGDLYPVTASSPIPYVFLVSQHTWYQRLGHPGREVLRHLVSNNFISYNKEKPLVL